MIEPLTFLSAAEKVLADHGEPMHYREMTRVALDRGLVET